MVAGLATAVAAGVVSGPPGAGAAGLGAGAVLLGTLLMARAAAGTAVAGATGTLLRLVLAMLAKWGLVAALGVLSIGVLKLPPLPFLAGLVVAIAAAMVAVVVRRPQ